MRVGGKRVTEGAAVVAAAGLAAGFTAVYWRDHPLMALFPWYFYAALMLAILVHELGHLLVGRLFGAYPLVVSIGNRRRTGGLRFGSVTVRLGFYPVGQVHWSVQPRPRGQWLTVAAGPLANLIFAGISAAVWAYWALPLLVGYSFTVMSALLGLVNLVPFRTREGSYSDGARLFGGDGVRLFGSVPPDSVPSLSDQTRLAFDSPPLPDPQPAADSAETLQRAAGTVRALCEIALTKPDLSAAELELTGTRIAWLAENAPRTPQVEAVLALYERRVGAASELAGGSQRVASVHQGEAE
ncbi:M50 family metallopeptidase [Nocardia sp. NPDC004151]|uniref:M50 family metallopeptidase n=1 Tax=Nocardia sp. NPDC004151 TaxID=3364304 RepID=UPI00368CAF5E